MKKIIRPQGPGEKKNLASILPEKKFSARTKIQSPLPPEYQMDRA